MTRRIGERHPYAAAPLLATAALALLLAGANAGLAWADELPANEPAKQQTPQVEALPQDAESNASANTTSTPDASAKNGTEAAGAAASASASSAATSNGANTVSEQAQSTNNRQNVNTGSSSNASKAPAQPVYDYLQSKSSPHLTYTKDGKPCKTYGWAHVNGSWYWFNNSPYASENCWRYVNGSWYHFDAAGVMQTGTYATSDGSLWHSNSSGAMITGNNGWVRSEGHWYWVAPNGKLSTGWKWSNGWYWLDKKTGAMATGWEKVGGSWYLMNGSGKMLTGWQWRGAWFYLNGSGSLHTGWLWDNGWYWIDENSGMATSWVNDNGTWYHCAKSGIMQSNAWVLDEKGLWHWAGGNGAMQSGWVYYKSIWYYLDPKDARHPTVTGTKSIAGKDYQFNSDGAMNANKWVVVNAKTGKARYASASGALTANAIIKNKSIVLTNEKGTPLSGWTKIDGRQFYATPDSGKAATGWLKIKDTWYYFNNQGAMQTGWVYTGGAWYLLGNNGAMRTGWQKVSGTWYYLDKQSGAMHTGWLKDGGTWYYLYGSGAMATGWVYVGGAYYYLNSSGAWDPNADPMYRKAQGYSSNTNWLILCDTTRNQVCIYWGSKGNWKLQKNWTCTTGAWDTPTVLGQYTVGAKGYVFGSGFSCYYYTQFCGNYLFHSVTYYQNTFNIMDGRLGMNLSHGCVRLQIDNAKWIYDNIPSGTKVVTF